MYIFAGPHLKYCNTVWGLRYVTDMTKLENVRQRAEPSKTVVLWEEIKLFEASIFILLSFWEDTLTTFQILMGYINIDATDFFQYMPTSFIRGHSYKLDMRFVTTDLRKSNRVVS